MIHFTFEQVKDWLGSDVDKTDLIDMIQDIANGVYKAEQLKEDIRSWVDESEVTQ
jgi:hypothetical protein